MCTNWAFVKLHVCTYSQTHYVHYKAVHCVHTWNSKSLRSVQGTAVLSIRQGAAHTCIHCMGIAVTSGSPCHEMAAHWPRIPDMWARVSLQAQYFWFSSHLCQHWLAWPRTSTSYALHSCGTYHVYAYVSCIYVIVNIEILTIPGGQV